MKEIIRKSAKLTVCGIRDMMDEHPYLSMLFTGLLSCFMFCASVLKLLKAVDISWGEIILPLGGAATIVGIIFIGCIVCCARPEKV